MHRTRTPRAAGLVLILTSSALAQGLNLPGPGELPGLLTLPTLPALPSGFDDLSGPLSGLLPGGAGPGLERGERALNWLSHLSQPGGWQSQLLGGLSPEQVLEQGLRRVGDRLAGELKRQGFDPANLSGTFEQARAALEGKVQALRSLDWLEGDLNTPIVLNPALLEQKRAARVQQAGVERARKDDLSSLERGVRAVGEAGRGVRTLEQSTARVLGQRDPVSGAQTARGVADRLSDAGQNATSTREAVGVLNTTLLESLKQKAVSDAVIAAQLEEVAQLQQLSNEQLGELVARIREQKLAEAQARYERIEGMQQQARSRAAELTLGGQVGAQRMGSLVSVPEGDWTALEQAVQGLK